MKMLNLVTVMVAIVAMALLLVVNLMASETSDKAPRIVREASQPVGFPQLTPVGKIQVKTYPVVRSASVSRNAGSQNSSFRTLFSHIKQNDIAMTSPVEMTYDERGLARMAFLYKSTRIGEVGKSGSVQVADIRATTVVSIGVRGSYTQERFDEKKAVLEAWLAEKEGAWVVDGNPRYLAFNSPFVPGMMKYGEVQIPIRPAGQVSQ